MCISSPRARKIPRQNTREMQGFAYSVPGHLAHLLGAFIRTSTVRSIFSTAPICSFTLLAFGKISSNLHQPIALHPRHLHRVLGGMPVILCKLPKSVGGRSIDIKCSPRLLCRRCDGLLLKNVSSSFPTPLRHLACCLIETVAGDRRGDTRRETCAGKTLTAASMLESSRISCRPISPCFKATCSSSAYLVPQKSLASERQTCRARRTAMQRVSSWLFREIDSTRPRLRRHHRGSCP